MEAVEFSINWFGLIAAVSVGLGVLGTVFWTAAFVPFAFVDPVILPIVIAAIAVPLHALAWLTADQEVREERSDA